jgi:hypothetical protein
MVEALKWFGIAAGREHKYAGENQRILKAEATESQFREASQRMELFKVRRSNASSIMDWAPPY